MNFPCTNIAKNGAVSIQSFASFIWLSAKKKKLCGRKSGAVTQNKDFACAISISVRYITKIRGNKIAIFLLLDDISKIDDLDRHLSSKPIDQLFLQQKFT